MCAALELPPGVGVLVQLLPSAGSLLGGFAVAFALPKGDFSFGSVSCWAQSKRAV